MCAPAAIMAVSAAAQAAAAARKQDRDNADANDLIRGREATLRTNIAKQEAYARENAGNLQPVMDAAGDDAAARATATQERVAAYDAAKPSPVISAAPTAVTGGGAPPVVTTEIQRRLKQADSAAAARTGKRAKLDAYGDVAGDRGLNANLARARIDMINNFSQGEAALLPGQLDTLETNINLRPEDKLAKGLDGLGKLGFMYGTTRAPNWSMFASEAARAKPGAGLAWRYDK